MLRREAIREERAAVRGPEIPAGTRRIGSGLLTARQSALPPAADEGNGVVVADDRRGRETAKERAPRLQAVVEEHDRPQQGTIGVIVVAAELDHGSHAVARAACVVLLRTHVAPAAPA